MFTDFMLRAFAAALLLAPICGALGVFVTARRMSFFSDTIAHGALAGVAIGAWLGLADLTIPMIGFSLVVALAILWLKEHTELLTDTIMALLLSGSVALGVILLGLQKANRGDLHAYLFGDILAIGPTDLWLAGGLFVGAGLWLFLRLSDLALLAAHEDMAHVCGVRVRRLNLAFVAVLTVAVAISIRLLGIILVTSLLVIPAATARNLSRNLRQQLLFSLLVGLGGGLGGIATAYALNVACGPAIVMVCILLFLFSLPANRLLGRQPDPKRA